MGPGVLRERAHRAAGTGHLSSAEHREVRQRGHGVSRRPCRRRWHARGVLRHACGHRLPYAHGQRHRCARLGRGRHRSGGSCAGPTHHDARAPRHRREADGRLVRRRVGHGRVADVRTNAARTRCGGLLCGMLRPRRGGAFRHPARLHLEHDPGVRLHLHAVPGGRPHPGLPAPHGPQRRAGGSG